MQLDVDVQFREIQCITPDESGGDEPYLWIFFLKLDGDTIQQVGNSLVPSITVKSEPGSHGNLGAKDIKRGRQVPIPAALGTFATRLRPIELSLLGKTLRIPGRLIAVAVIMEEDESPDDGIENAHQSLRNYIQKRVSQFVTGLSIMTIAAQASDRATRLGGNVEDHAQAIVNEGIASVAADIKSSAQQLVELEVMAAHTPGAIWEFLDADEKIGEVELQFDMRELLTGPGGSSRLLWEQIYKEEDRRAVWVYRLFGLLTSTVTSSPTDLRETRTTVSAVIADHGRHINEIEDRCAKAGQHVDWARMEQVEESVFILDAPFIPITWSIDGIELGAPAGPLTLADKDCRFPYLDLAKLRAHESREQVKDVVISYERFQENGLPGVRLRNRPEDGTYWVTLEATGTIGVSKKVVLATRAFMFNGQWIECPFIERYRACMGVLQSIGELGAQQRKRLTKKDLWGPQEKERWFDEQVTLGRDLVRAGVFTESRFAAAQEALRRHLGLGSAANAFKAGPGDA